MDPGGHAITIRLSGEAIPASLSDYLERQFQLAYGRDDLKPETRETMLYSQLQEGLFVKSPSVSGCQERTFPDNRTSPGSNHSRRRPMKPRTHNP